MRTLWLLLAVLPAAGVDWLCEVRERGAELEAAHRWEEAVQLYRSTLDRSSPADMSSRMWLLTSLAEIEFDRQDYAASEQWLHRAEQITGALSADAPERIRLLTARGTLYLVRGNLTAAHPDLSRAVQLSALSSVPEDRAAALHNLAAVEMQLARLPEAADHERQALEIWRNRLGEKHEYVLKGWISLSSLQGLCGDWPAAEQSLRRALAIHESEEALANYAVVLVKLKRGKEAKAIRLRLRRAPSPQSDVVDFKSLAQQSPPAIRTR